ncbi:Cleavage stimulation factor subunit 50 [Hibiscus syriacus]|uniref:Cleavage stimulation factor 50 kDa subunit n=1 Tax=Hibiscus syriacus TaxID=106335 RepID=A0A6A2XN51_HIBSY|nr:Cleavage stimulation factor subunit 50 [Hibiscus syriacus]
MEGNNLEKTLQEGNLYRQLNCLIVAHLRHHNLTQAARAVASATMTPLDVEAPPNKLLELVVKGLAVENDETLQGVPSSTLFDLGTALGYGSNPNPRLSSVDFRQYPFAKFPYLSILIVFPVYLEVPCHQSSIRGALRGWNGDTASIALFAMDTKGSTKSFPRHEIRHLSEHKNIARCARFSTDGKFVATGSADTSIKLFEISKIKQMMLPDSKDGPVRPVIRTFYDHVQPINDLDFHPQSTVLISGAKDNTIKFFDFSKATAKRAFRVIQDTHNVRSVSFHPSGDFLIAGTDHPIPHLYDVNTFQCYLSANPPEIGVNGAINQVRYSSTGGMYVTASKDGVIRLWDGVRVPVGKNCVTVIIFNIPKSFHYKVLWLFFDKYGEVVDSFIPNKRSKGGSRFGFVRFTRLEDARKAINCVHRSWIQGNKIRVFMARYLPRDVFWRKFSGLYSVEGNNVRKDVSHTVAPIAGSIDDSKFSTLKDSLLGWCRIFIKWVESSSFEEAVVSPLSKVRELVGAFPVKFPELEEGSEEAGRSIHSSEVQSAVRCSENEEKNFCCLGTSARGSLLSGEGDIGEALMMGLRSDIGGQRMVLSQMEGVGEHKTLLVHAEREAVDVFKDTCLPARGFVESKDFLINSPIQDGLLVSKELEDVSLKDKVDLLVHVERDNEVAFRKNSEFACAFVGSKDYFNDFPMLVGRVEIREVEEGIHEGCSYNYAFVNPKGIARQYMRPKVGSGNKFRSKQFFQGNFTAPKRKYRGSRSKSHQSKVHWEEEVSVFDGRFTYESDFPALGQSQQKDTFNSLPFGKYLGCESNGAVVYLLSEDDGGGRSRRFR